MIKEKINSTLVAQVNLFNDQTKKLPDYDVLGQIVTDISLKRDKNYRYITPAQVKQAILFPYSNFKSALITKANYFKKLTIIQKQEDACLKLIKEIEKTTEKLDQLQENNSAEHQEKIQQCKKKLEQDRQNLQLNVEKIATFKQKVREWNKLFEKQMDKHRHHWLQLRRTLAKETVQALEKSLKAKLSESEAKQLYEIESIDSIYKRYEELGVKPPISYKKALKDPKSIVLLKAYIIGREVKNRESIQ